MESRFCLPTNTCPIIDDVIATLESAVKESNHLLEQIRTANSELREAAETWQKEIDEVEEDRNSLDEKLTEALSEIADLKAQLKAQERAIAA